jgi:arsenate reductase
MWKDHYKELDVDYKNYLLQHYTFLSRPVFIINDKIFIGNSQQNILQVMKAMTNV